KPAMHRYALVLDRAANQKSRATGKSETFLARPAARWLAFGERPTHLLVGGRRQARDGDLDVPVYIFEARIVAAHAQPRCRLEPNREARWKYRRGERGRVQRAGQQCRKQKQQ